MFCSFSVSLVAVDRALEWEASQIDTVADRLYIKAGFRGGSLSTESNTDPWALRASIPLPGGSR